MTSDSTEGRSRHGGTDPERGECRVDEREDGIDLERRPSADPRDSRLFANPVPAPHAVLGRVPTGTTISRELAAAARSRGHRSTVRDEICRIYETLQQITVPEVELEPARQRLAETSGREEALRERVSAARGAVSARRSVDADPTTALADLEEAAASLSEVRTERVAAEQALARQRTIASEARDARDQRLQLQDRLTNRRRTARNELAQTVYPCFREALTAVPGGDPDSAGSRPGEYDGDRLAGSLAVIRIAALSTPVTLSKPVIKQFESITTKTTDDRTAPSPSENYTNRAVETTAETSTDMSTTPETVLTDGCAARVLGVPVIRPDP